MTGPHDVWTFRCERAALVCLLANLGGACSASTLPGPEQTLQAYARAEAKGDERALYDLLTTRSQEQLGRQGVAQAVRDGRRELAEQSRVLQGTPPPNVSVSAQVAFHDGETTSFDLEDGAFRLTSADALPASARTPTQALDQLRKVLARRSYAGLLRVLSQETRHAMEQDIRALVDGLEQPDTLEIKRNGDRATVSLPGGHRVVLRREQGYWQVDDFD